ncbi:ATP-binding protein [Paraflavisolibacter sp. H34]|uniref:sensor histidine kinase n=1 Tax=Huijunlia imazamoxiresistens TaxID=3127457 RepID=UPI003015FED6
MRFIRSYTRSHAYRFLPHYCRYLLEQRLDALSRQQLLLAREAEVPALRLLAHYSDDQLVALAKSSMTEFLGMLIQNRVTELIEQSLERWKADQLEVIGQFELVAEDIYLINYVRSRAFRLFIPEYTTDQATSLELVDELDSFFTGNTTAAANTYIQLLKGRIARHEAELLEAQQIARIGSFEWDLQTRKANSSPELYRIFEIEPGLGMDGFMQFVHPADRDKVARSLALALEKGAYESEFRYLKNDQLKYMWSRGIAVFIDGMPVKLVGTVQDITLRKKAELELQEKTAALERSNESLEQFAHVASHDLKEPLRKIASFTDLVLSREESLTEKGRLTLQKAHHCAVQARRMIDDIMAYSTLKQWEDRTETALADVVREVLEVLESTIEEKQAKIVFDELPEIKVVPAQFRQLFQNLVSNALKFSRPQVPPRIFITHSWLGPEEGKRHALPTADRYLQLQVQDNGIGFSPGAAEKIFGLFTRLHGKGEYEGSGLGLAIAKRIMDNHCGIVSAASREGEGATFTLILPQ